MPFSSAPKAGISLECLSLEATCLQGGGGLWLLFHLKLVSPLPTSVFHTSWLMSEMPHDSTQPESLWF